MRRLMPTVAIAALSPLSLATVRFQFRREDDPVYKKKLKKMQDEALRRQGYDPDKEDDEDEEWISPEEKERIERENREKEEQRRLAAERLFEEKAAARNAQAEKAKAFRERKHLDAMERRKKRAEEHSSKVRNERFVSGGEISAEEEEKLTKRGDFDRNTDYDFTNGAVPPPEK